MATTYTDLLKTREMILSLSNEAKDEMSHLWARVCDGGNFTDDEVKKIARRHNCMSEALMAFYSWYELDTQDSVVVFYHDNGLHQYDVRVGTQYLPREVIVVAFVSDKGASFVHHHVKDEQIEEDLKKTLQEALFMVKSFRYTADELIEQGVLIFNNRPTAKGFVNFEQEIRLSAVKLGEIVESVRLTEGRVTCSFPDGSRAIWENSTWRIED